MTPRPNGSPPPGDGPAFYPLFRHASTVDLEPILTTSASLPSLRSSSPALTAKHLSSSLHQQLRRGSTSSTSSSGLRCQHQRRQSSADLTDRRDSTSSSSGNSSDESASPAAIRTPRLGEFGRMTPEFIEDLIPFYRAQRRLPTSTLIRILVDARDFYRFDLEDSLVEINLGRDDVVNVCGDIHGQFYDLANILELRGEPSTANRYLFNGDFVDRGAWSVEVMILLLSLKLAYPGVFHLVRGNHESEEINRSYGFHAETLEKYDERIFKLFQEVFNWLPVAHLINRSILVMHGGLPNKDGVTLDDIRDIRRGGQPERNSLMCDLLWSDPRDEEGRIPNQRGYSCLFGPDVTEKFLAANDLLYIIRSHECVQYGFDLTHDDKVVTVFSAPNYCDRHTNKGAICIIHGDDVSMPEFKKFTAVPHPPAQTYSNMLMKMRQRL